MCTGRNERLPVYNAVSERLEGCEVEGDSYRNDLRDAYGSIANLNLNFIDVVVVSILRIREYRRIDER